MMVLYSPQMLNTFADCPLKYYWKYVRNINIPQPERHFLTGKNIHAIAAYYLNGDDVSMFELTDSETLMWNNLRNFELFNLKPFKVESSVMMKIENFWIGGRIDALFKNNNEYCILDYKTGEIPKNSKDNFQTIVYLLCCDNLIKDYNKLSFTYINVKSGEFKTIELTPELREYYVSKLKNIVFDIERISTPEKIGNNKCNICSYQKVCI